MKLLIISFILSLYLIVSSKILDSGKVREQHIKDIIAILDNKTSSDLEKEMSKQEENPNERNMQKLTKRKVAEMTIEEKGNRLKTFPSRTNIVHEDFIDIFSVKWNNMIYIRNINCTVTNCNLPNICLNNSTCMCREGYVNLKTEDTDNESYCQYKQKSQLIALLLEFFTNSGLGLIYIGKYAHGGIKLFVIVFLFSSYFCKSKNDEVSCLSFMTCTLVCFSLLMYILDIVNLATNSYLDLNNIPLKEW